MSCDNDKLLVVKASLLYQRKRPFFRGSFSRLFSESDLESKSHSPNGECDNYFHRNEKLLVGI